MRVRPAGSSPPTWGIPRRWKLGTAETRFIPTYVGHTFSLIGWGRFLPVHPHLRGAYGHGVDDASRHGGSSPPTWGIPFQFVGGNSIFRFIPTYVGHTGLEIGVKLQIPVHPHLRGAYVGACGVCNCQAGSSPPTWGIHQSQTERVRL